MIIITSITSSCKLHNHPNFIIMFSSLASHSKSRNMQSVSDEECNYCASDLSFNSNFNSCQDVRKSAEGILMDCRVRLSNSRSGSSNSWNSSNCSSRSSTSFSNSSSASTQSNGFKSKSTKDGWVVLDFHLKGF